MNINPSTMKELLQLQLLNKMSFLSSDNNPKDGSSNSFSDLLNDILSKTSTGIQGVSSSSSNKLSPLQSMSFSPTMAYMNGHAQEVGISKNAADFDPLIQAASRRHGVESSLVKAVIDAESSFNSKAVSGAGAKGLMQLMDDTGKGLGVVDPFDPAQNIQGGTRYLSNLLTKYNGNRGVALAAYNAGPGRIDKLGISNDQELMSKLHLLPSETQQYVSKVMRLQRNYEA